MIGCLARKSVCLWTVLLIRKCHNWQDAVVKFYSCEAEFKIKKSRTNVEIDVVQPYSLVKTILIT